MQRNAPNHEKTAMKTFPTAFATLLLAAAFAGPLAAQLAFQVEGVSDPSFLGDTLVFDSEGIGQRVSKRVYLNFDASTSSSVTLRSVQVKGSSEFSYEITDVPRLPVVIRNELQLEMFVSYLPSGPGPAEAVLELALLLDDSDLGSANSVYSINLVGRVPSYTLSYSLPGMPVRTVPVEGSVDFGNRGIGHPTESTLILTNNGSGPGILRALVLSGSPAYRALSPPSVPASIPPGRSLNIVMAFTPTLGNSYAGQLVFDFGAVTRRYHLAGVGGDLLQYSLQPRFEDDSAGPAARLQSGTTIEFAQGATAIELTGTNVRQNAQVVRSIGVTGAFQVVEAPSQPASVQPQASLSVRIEPEVSALGDYSGSLLIGDAYFPLSFSLADLSGMSFAGEGGAVDPQALVPVALSIDRPYPYDLSGVATLSFVASDFESDPAVQWSSGGRQLAFEIPSGSTTAMFSTATGEASFQSSRISGEMIVTASVRADHWGLDLTPDEEPEVRFTVEIPDPPSATFSSAGGPVEPTSEVPVGLSIDQPYPIDVSGVLSLEFISSDFESDPTVQWSTGGRQVTFDIPAGSTAAMFGGGASEVTFRAAKSSGEVVVTATMRADDWGLNLTEDAVPEVRFDVTIAELPGVSFSRNGETVGAAEQVPLALSIAEPYETDLVGALTLSFETRKVVTDPSVQWVTGGRIAPFWIPRGSTAAVFHTIDDTNAFQTGTVAGEIVVTATLMSIREAIPLTIEEATRLETAIDLTPDEVPQARFNVMEAAPVVQRVALGSTGQGRFSVAVTGYATSREVDALSFTFSGIPGSDLSTPSLEASVSDNFRTYFGGNQSAAFGSQFTATVEFSLDEGVFEDLSNVSVTATNGDGTSNSVSLGLN